MTRILCGVLFLVVGYSSAQAASKYAKAIGAKQRELPVGMSDALERGLGGIKQAGSEGGFGGGEGVGGMPSLGFLPGRGTGLFFGGREITTPRGDWG